MKKFSLYTIVFLMICGKALSQCSINDYEKAISDHCGNCSQSQVNRFLYKKCKEADSSLANYRERFHTKVITRMNGSKEEMCMVEEKYDRSFDALVKARSTVFKNYDSLTNTGDNRYYTQLFYWYYTDKTIEILKDMESTVFGDNIR